MLKIAPSLLAADFSKLAEEIKKVENADMLHLDVMDGHYVPNISFGPAVIKAARKVTKMYFDCQLMIDNPDRYLKQFVDAGCNSISFHPETVKDPLKTIETLKIFGVKAGIAINNRVPIENAYPFLSKVDFVLVMSVEAGFGGQKFNSEALQKIKALSEELQKRKLKLDIEVDGGVTLENAPDLVKAGANILVTGTSVFGTPNPSETVEKFRELGSLLK